MRRKNVTSEMMKDFMTESFLLLLEKKSYEEISIGEIAAKAGVNRSTYYRNFSSKEAIIEHFFTGIMDSWLACARPDMSTREYLTGMFHAFLAQKRPLMTLYRRRVFYILFGTLNRYFLQHSAQGGSPLPFDERFSLYYHTGGVFNALLLWFENDMQPSPEELATLSVQIIAPGFKPALLRGAE